MIIDWDIDYIFQNIHLKIHHNYLYLQKENTRVVSQSPLKEIHQTID
jgi:hypothetical protein